MTDLRRSMTDMTAISEQLRFSRESRGLSLEEVSRILCLPVATLKAIESNNQEALPPPVFVRGYIRNYANLLKISLSEEAYSTSDVVFPKQASSVNREILPILGQVFLKSLNYFIIIGLITLISIWWHDRQYSAEKEFSVLNLSIQQNPFPKPVSIVPPELNDPVLMAVIRPWWPFNMEDKNV